ncbi:MAG: response regulator transcription factor [Candidatus Melainabacteria bacterium]|nr:response regulator transcription factor [Candidatus Melainabacteria bacterium]
MFRILLVDDDTDLCTSVKNSLALEGMETDCAYDAETALAMLSRTIFDVLVIDWKLPAKSGLDLCRDFRELGGTSPIIMLTGRDKIEDKERGFGAGVDDYLTKPFHVKELALRINALLKRSRTDDILSFRDLRFHTRQRKLYRNETEIILSPTQYNLLEFLMRHPDQSFRSETLLARIWPADSDATEQTVRTYIMRLRKVLDIEGESTYIENRYGIGYQLNG